MTPTRRTPKDPKVIATLGRLNKVVRHRVLAEDYQVLRKLGRIYHELDSDITALRCKIDRLLIELFCDFSFTKDFLYGNTGAVLIERFGCNPYRIIEAGRETFSAIMKQAVPRIRRDTIERLWQDSESSVLNELPEGYRDVLEDHFRDLITQFRDRECRKEHIVGADEDHLPAAAR